MQRNDWLRTVLAYRPMTLADLVKLAGGRWTYKNLHQGLAIMAGQGLVLRHRVAQPGRRWYYRYVLTPGAQKPRPGRPGHCRQFVLSQLRRHTLSNRALADRCDMPFHTVREVTRNLVRAGLVERLAGGPGRGGYRYRAVVAQGRLAV